MPVFCIVVVLRIQDEAAFSVQELSVCGVCTRVCFKSCIFKNV